MMPDLYNSLLDIYARIGELADVIAASGISDQEAAHELIHISDALYPIVQAVGAGEHLEAP